MQLIRQGGAVTGQPLGVLPLGEERAPTLESFYLILRRVYPAVLCAQDADAADSTGWEL